jgi:hypothetical protein
LQKLRHNFVPGTPSSLADVASTKIVFEHSELPIKDELTDLFPTLLSKGAAGMPMLNMKVDNENGTLLKCEKPLMVCTPFPRLNFSLVIGRLRLVGWIGRRWTQCCDGSVRHD